MSQCHTEPNPSLQGLISLSLYFISQKCPENKLLCVMLKYCRSGRLYKNMQRLGFFLNASSISALGLHSIPYVPSIYLHQDKISNYLANCLKAQRKFAESRISLTENNLQGQIGGKWSVSIVKHAFKATDRLNEYRPLLPPVACPGAAGHGQDRAQVLCGEWGEGTILHPAGELDRAEWAIATLCPEKETEGKDQYLPMKKRSKIYRKLF